jgi:hypothetical protein
MPNHPSLPRLALGLLLLGVVGTAVELLLLEHFDGWKMMIPLVLFGLATLATLMVLLVGGRTWVRVFQVVMLAFVISGALGTWFHYSGNVEFELEMTADAAGWSLFTAAMTGATPALAPGTMIWFGLLGLLTAWVISFPSSLTSQSNSPLKDEP